MTTYPLPTLAAQITLTGISAPSYADIIESLKAQIRTIYGSDIYIEPDSQDGQYIAIYAAAQNDANQAAIAVYNSFSPNTAIGTGLSNNVAINGIKRLSSSFSTVDVTIGGQYGTIINFGIIEDELGNKWDLPSTVTIGLTGEVIVTAVAQQPGDITALADTVTTIGTPTRGWQTVTNVAAATPGAPVETDAALRLRQTISTSLAAETPLEKIEGVVRNLTGVTLCKSYENDTNSTDSDTLPPHSISLVVQGGDAIEIANAINRSKNPGTATYGTTTEIVTDDRGVPNTIKFYRPTVPIIGVHITVKALTGYVSTTEDLIKQALADYINELGIGATSRFIFNSKLYGPVDNLALGKTFNITVLTTNKNGGGFSASDIAIAFNELPSCSTSDIVLTVT